MEFLTINLDAKVQSTVFQGKKYLVAPATLIVPGVLNGSDGPLYYPLDEIRRDPSSWNGVPITVYHPERGGKPISARSPGVLEKQQIGLIFSARANGKLGARLYFDEERTKKISPVTYEALKTNTPMELSTGLHIKKVPAPEGSSYNGKEYTHVATQFKPDHLAILPDQIGACSLEDGCGLNVNSRGRFELSLVMNSISDKEKAMRLSDEQRAEMVQDLISNCECWDQDDQDVLIGLADAKLEKLVSNITRTSTSKSESTQTDTLNLEDVSMDSLQAELSRRQELLGNENEKKNEATATQVASFHAVGNALSAEQWLEMAPPEVKSTFQYAHQIESEQKDILIEKLTANLQEGPEKKIQAERLRSRSIDDLKADVSLIPEPKVETTANVEGNKYTPDWLGTALSKMVREPEDQPLPLPSINWANEGAMGEAEGVMSTPGAGNEDPTQWLRSAPTHVQEVVRNAFKSEQREKDEIITKLVSNVDDSNERFRMRDRLEGKPLSELQEVMKLMPASDKGSSKRNNYTGAAAPSSNASVNSNSGRLSDADKEDILPLPSMSFGTGA